MISNHQDFPNYALAQLLAYKTVYFSGQNKLPLSIKKIIKNIPNLHIQKYSRFAKKRNLSLKETCEILDSEEGCLWMRSDGQYIILYNDTIKNKGRVRFTIAHELGHYVLKHNKKSDRTCLARYSLTDQEYDIFEKEANYFARRLLAPLPLVELYRTNWKKITATCIEFAFNTSHTVAEYVLDDLNKRRRYTQTAAKIRFPIIDKFIGFINGDTNSQICKQCFSLHKKYLDFCTICGNNSFIKAKVDTYPYFHSERKKVMAYTKLNTDLEGRLAEDCPICGNDNVRYNYCSVCGVPIINKCTGMVKIEDGQNSHYEENQPCSETLYGADRYCPICGAVSTFYFHKLLRDWNASYNSTIDISDDDLPF